MEHRRSNTNQLVDRESITINPYFDKKSEVMYFYAKVLYGVVIFILFGFGVYFLSISKQEDISKDFYEFNKKSAEWNESMRSEFKDWTISLRNEKNVTIYLENEAEKMHKYDDIDSIYYNPLQKVAKNLAPLIEDIKLNKQKSDKSVRFNFILKIK
jgi:hypothetical protein